MSTIISTKPGNPPQLKPRFTQPDGWTWGTFQNAKGQHLRYGWTMPKDPKGLVIIAPGLSEFCEKYFETIRDLKNDGYAVAIMEWRGHGLSWRHLEDRQKRHSDGFENDVEDFHKFYDLMAGIRKEKGFDNVPTALLAHSMGGNIALRYIHDHPDSFASATLTAPMLGINVSAAQRPILKPLCAFFNRIGKGDWYAPGQGKWTESKYRISAEAALSSDPERREVATNWLTWNPDLQAGGVTYNWLLEAAKSCETVQNPAFLKQIRTKCFFAIAEHESIVSNADIFNAIQHMPDIQVKEYEHAKHEIMMERDQIRNAFLRDFKEFAFKMT